MSREVVKALKEEKAEAAEVRVAEAKAQSIAERIADLDQDIALEQKLRETANRKADNAHRSQSALAEQWRARSSPGQGARSSSNCPGTPATPSSGR